MINIKIKNATNINLMLKNFGSNEHINAYDKKIRMLFFGELRFNKGIDIFIKLIEELNKRDNQIIGVIAGYTKYCDHLKSLIKNPNAFELDIRVIPNNEIPNIFTSSDYLVLPYRDITQSGVAMIAFNYNLPIIANNLDGFKEYIVDQQNGIMIDINDINTSAEKIYQLINKNNYRDILIQNIIKTKNLYFEPRVILDKYIKFFNTVCNE